jgi:hypothetical protein
VYANEVADVPDGDICAECSRLLGSGVMKSTELSLSRMTQACVEMNAETLTLYCEGRVRYTEFRMIEDHVLYCAACSAFVAEFVRKAAADRTDVLDREKVGRSVPGRS